MIVRIIPETELERQHVKEVEHTDVKEFFMFGNRLDSDGNLIDFYDWSGQYRYLIGGLEYFKEIVNDERRAREGTAASPEMQVVPAPLAAKVQLPDDNRKFTVIPNEELNETLIEEPEEALKVELKAESKEQAEEVATKLVEGAVDEMVKRGSIDGVGIEILDTAPNQPDVLEVTGTPNIDPED